MSIFNVKHFLILLVLSVVLAGCMEYPEYAPPSAKDRIESYEHILDDGTRCVVITLRHSDAIGVVCDFPKNY